MRTRLLGLAASLLAAGPLFAATFTVTNTNDSGAGSLRHELVARNITGGCGNGNYCPADPATRGQMAVFLVKTFSLQ